MGAYCRRHTIWYVA